MAQDPLAKRAEDKWRVGKEIPLTLIFLGLSQLCYMVYAIGNMTSKFDNMAYQIAALNSDKYTASDAAKDQAISLIRFTEITRRISNLEEDKKDHGNPRKQR